MKTMLNNEQVDSKIAAFDEWLEGQSEPVRDTVRNHITLLTKAVATMGVKSAKILLSGVYLRVLKVTSLPGPVGAERPVLVIVEGANEQ